MVCISLNRLQSKYVPQLLFKSPAATDEKKNRICDSNSQAIAHLIKEFMRKNYHQEDFTSLQNHHLMRNVRRYFRKHEASRSQNYNQPYKIVGHPDGCIAEHLSWEKFTSTYVHIIWRIVRWDFNAQTLICNLRSDRRTAITELLATWLYKTQYTILEAAELHGKPTDAPRVLSIQKKRTRQSLLQPLLANVRQFYKRANNIQHFKAQ